MVASLSKEILTVTKDPVVFLIFTRTVLGNLFISTPAKQLFQNPVWLFE